MLGIASIQGLPVASFKKDDAERLLFFCSRKSAENSLDNPVSFGHPSWLIPPTPTRKRAEPSSGIKYISSSRLQIGESSNGRPKLNIAAMRPIPPSHRQKILPFSGLSEGERYDGERGKSNLPVSTAKHNGVGSNPATHKKSLSTSFQAQQIISLNPLPMKKHGCDRAPIRACSEVSC